MVSCFSQRAQRGATTATISVGVDSKVKIKNVAPLLVFSSTTFRLYFFKMPKPANKTGFVSKKRKGYQ